jgi:hypothetical protein
VRKIVVYELLSLDGVAEAPDTFFTDWDEAMDANLAAQRRLGTRVQRRTRPGSGECRTRPRGSPRCRRGGRLAEARRDCLRAAACRKVLGIQGHASSS